MGRHEERQHGGVAEQEAMEEDEKKEDYRYNYHCAKLTFGLILMEFNDCVKEGDGDRLFSLYRIISISLIKVSCNYARVSTKNGE